MPARQQARHDQINERVLPEKNGLQRSAQLFERRGSRVEVGVGEHEVEDKCEVMGG